MRRIYLLMCGVAWMMAGGCRAPTDPVRSRGPVAAVAPALAVDRFSPWSEPVNLGPVVNSPSTDFTPDLSPDGLSLYFASNRPGGFGATDLYVAHRASSDQPWGAPVNLGAVVNSARPDGAPQVSRDGHYLYFTSGRPGGFGSNDIWVSWRANTNDDFAWETPTNLGPEVNSSGFEGGITIRLPEAYVASDRAAPGGPLDIYLNVMGPGGTFGPGVLVAELSSEGNDLHPTILFDGRELFLSSDRGGSVGSDDLWVATRAAFGGPWSVPVNLGNPVNTQYSEAQPSLSADGRILVFVSDRPGGEGGEDLYMTMREIGGQ
jgi:hypothetical protein